jgi:hypothetical protein
MSRALSALSKCQPLSSPQPPPNEIQTKPRTPRHATARDGARHKQPPTTKPNPPPPHPDNPTTHPPHPNHPTTTQAEAVHNGGGLSNRPAAAGPNLRVDRRWVALWPAAARARPHVGFVRRTAPLSVGQTASAVRLTPLTPPTNRIHSSQPKKFTHYEPRVSATDTPTHPTHHTPSNAAGPHTAFSRALKDERGGGGGGRGSRAYSLVTTHANFESRPTIVKLIAIVPQPLFVAPLTQHPTLPRHDRCLGVILIGAP